VQCIVKTTSLLLQPSSLLVAFAKRQVRNAKLYAGPERRSEPRDLVVMPVVVQPVDEQLCPLGEPLAMVTRDLSPKGVGLIHEQRLPHDRIAIRLLVQADEVILVGAVRWRKPLGPFYLCGCEIVDKLPCFPTPLSRIRTMAPDLTRPNSPAAASPFMHLSDGQRLA